MFRWAVVGALACASIASAEDSAAPPAAPPMSVEKLSEILQMEVPEIKSRMEKVFEKADANTDGIIDEDEARQWGTKLKDAMHKHQVSLEFQSIDKNSDGKVSLEELEQTYTEGADPKQAATHKEEVRKRFVAVDKDEDGSLSLAEVTILMDPGSDSVLMKIEIDEIMAAQDKDSDGVISLEEFLSTEGGSLSPEERAELSREFSNFDLNKDNNIDEEELKKIIRDPHAHELNLLMEKFVLEMDNGKITKEHWEKKVETFAVSMLTDNGEVLRFPEDYEGLDFPFKSLFPKTKTVDVDEESTEKHEEL